MVVFGTANAQWDMGSTPTSDTSKSAAAGGSGGGGWGDAGASVTPEAPKKIPYVRFYPPYDSLREIIFYEGMVENEDCDLCTGDSLYKRAKRFLTKRYGKSQLKKMILDEKAADHITLKVMIPMVVVNGRYNKQANGMMEYKVVLRFKDSRYKYQFGNFVHIKSGEGLSETSTKTYHEYYLRVKKGFEATDKFLIAADTEVKSFVAGLTYALKQPYQPDEDDW